MQARKVCYELLFHQQYPETISLVATGLPLGRDALPGANSLEALATSLAERLDYYSQDYPGVDDAGVSGDSYRTAFWRLFSDGQRMGKSGWQGFLSIERGRISRYSFDMLLACAAFFKAVCLFLGSGERYVQMDAWVVYLFSAWQWFNLVKLALEECERDPRGACAPGSGLHEEVEREFAAAYRALAPLLANQRFAYAVRWLNQWQASDTDSGPLLREQLRLSMVLSPVEMTRQQRDQLDPSKPLKAPGCFTSGKMEWSQVRLHPQFGPGAEEDARAEIRRIISTWLLPRYDFESSLRLSMLLKQARSPRLPRWKFTSLPLSWAVALCMFFVPLLAAAGGTAITSLSGGPAGQSVIKWIPEYEFLIVFVLPLLVFLTLFDFHTLKYFALPRIIGGVFIGYLALALQGDSINVMAVFWQPISLPVGDVYGVCLLWIIVVIAGILYLLFDTLALVRDTRAAAGRAVLTWLLALIASGVIGLVVVAITTQAYMNETHQVDLFNAVFLGPFGQVNIFQYLVFVPLALFTGLVTQFIFEEQTVTASVWAAEQE
ncbi:MAG: hypothetical protein GYA17_00800 [Chloroflexi bacterium]|nr:hypothetical protein [Chloroflexota bacterium]